MSYLKDFLKQLEPQTKEITLEGKYHVLATNTRINLNDKIKTFMITNIKQLKSTWTQKQLKDASKSEINQMFTSFFTTALESMEKASKDFGTKVLITALPDRNNFSEPFIERQIVALKNGIIFEISEVFIEESPNGRIFTCDFCFGTANR